MVSITPPLANQEIYTVSRLNQRVRLLLEQSFAMVWVEGEISNLSHPSSGHLYFSLKDARAQIRCALFRNRTKTLRESPGNGQQVRLQARISLYEPRGDFQLIVEQIEPAGAGDLRRAYDELRLRLQQQGLFEPAHKRTPPRFPRRVGVITSASGAAIRDVLSVLRRRFPALPVLIYPVPVQGDAAGQEIARSLALASQRRDCDVLLLVRGGGSLEDLWAFNEEVVARAIHACEIPVVCGVGHETDVTIADFAADLRAPTPSVAAELISPDRTEWLAQLETMRQRLLALMGQQLERRQQSTQLLLGRLLRQHPGQRLQQREQRLDELEMRMGRALAAHLTLLRGRIEVLSTRLRAQTPMTRIERSRQRCHELSQRLQAIMARRLELTAQRLNAASRALNAVSPLQTLERGYAIVRNADGSVIRSTEQVHRDDQLEVLLSEGRLVCQIKEIKR